MIKDEEKFADTNASPSAYGWAFQVGAGIKLMLDHITEFTALKMEGKDEDIEITLPNGKLYAQAKSVTQRGAQSSASQCLKKSLKTLSADAKKDGNPAKLIYITNILNPLSDTKGISPYYGNYDREYDFSNLPEDDQKKICNLVDADFPLDKFHIHVVEFFGEGANKFARIKEYIKGLLNDAKLDTSLVESLWAKWLEMFLVNCTDKPDETKSFDKKKKEIIYPIIILAIDPPISRDMFEKISDYDDYDEIVAKYRDLINARGNEYEFTASIIGEYKSRKNGDSQYKYEFVKEVWQEYEEYFSQIADDAIRQAVVKLALLTVIVHAGKIDNIHKAVNI